MRIQFFILLLVIPPTAVAQQGTEADKNDARYNAVLWSQSSPEYSVAVKQSYWLARLQLAAGLADENHTADERQFKAADYQAKKPAIILDVDETVLDNSAYNARNIQDASFFNATTWNAWVEEAIAPAVPGAVEFIQHAQERGVAVFLVTNRRDENRAGTLKNLQQVGLNVPAEHLLLRNDDAGRGGDKVSRRDMVAKDHRIILLIGDNIADMCEGTHGKPAAEAKRIAADKQKKFGNGWVMLPNPTYGGWERTGDDLRTQRTSRPSQQTEASQPSAASATAKSPMPNAVKSNQIPSQTQWVPSPQPNFIPLSILMKNRPCQCPCCRCCQRPRRFNSRR